VVDISVKSTDYRKITNVNVYPNIIEIQHTYLPNAKKIQLRKLLQNMNLDSYSKFTPENRNYNSTPIKDYNGFKMPPESKIIIKPSNPSFWSRLIKALF